MPENSYTPPAWIPFMAFICAQIAIIGAGIICCNGAMTLFKWIMLSIVMTAGFVPLALLSAFFTLLQTLFDRLVGLFQKCLDIAIENGQAILQGFGWKPKEERSAESTVVSDATEPDQSEFAYRPSEKGFDPMGLGSEQMGS